MLLSGGRRIGVHGDVPLPRVHIHRPWWRTPTVVGGGAVGNRGGVAGVQRCNTPATPGLAVVTPDSSLGS
jgi:hypothetical protein